MAGNNVEIEYLFADKHMLAEDISSFWQEWKLAKSSAEKLSAEVIKYVFATDTTHLTEGSDWNHKTHIPKITSIYDTLKANYLDGLLPNRRWMRIEGEDDKSQRREFQRRIEGFLRTKHRVRGFRSRIEELLDDWIIYGNCFAEVFFVYETAYNKDTDAHEVIYQGPDVRRISPQDIAFNPLAVDFRSTPKIVRRLKTVGDVARDIEEGVMPSDEYDLTVINDLLSRRQLLGQYSDEDINKSIQITVDGFGTASQYLKGHTIEFLDFYGDMYDRETGTLHKNSVITVADRNWVVRNTKVPTWDGRPMLFHSGWRKRRDNLWAQGPLDNLVGMQYRLNHLENARADMFDEMLNGDLVFQGDVEIEYGENNQKIYRALEGGNVRRLVPDTTVLQADFQINALESKMEFFAGTPREASGFRSPGEKTKFEFSQLMNAGARIFQHKLTAFELEMLGPILNAEIELSADNLIGKDLARLEDETSGVKEMAQVTRSDLKLNGKVIPMGSRHYIRQQQLAQDLRDFSQAAATDPSVLQHFPAKKLARMWEEVMAFEEFDLFEEFGRISEQVEGQQLLSAGQQLVAEEEVAGIESLDEEAASVQI